MTPRRIRRGLTTVLLLLLLTAAESRPQQQQTTSARLGRRHDDDHSADFACTRILPDGEVERRVRKGRVSAMETTVVSSAGGQDPPQVFLTLLQVTDGRHFIQLIYDSGRELRDCEYLQSVGRAVDSFRDAFSADPDCRWGNDSTSLAVFVSNNGTDVTDYASLRRECKGLHRKIRRERQFRRRKKRDLFLYPGTNWCGSGSNARKFNELGYNAAADRCCRDHDHCPYTIEGFTRKYHFFNFRFHTISHCDCDERFRACLKLSGTAAGNMVGKLFFNVVQTKCFLFKHVKQCAKRSWWGKCLKYEKDKAAELREALKY